MGNTTEPKVQEYLYRYDGDMEGMIYHAWRTNPEGCKARGWNPYTTTTSAAHRVTKRTDKFIFVEDRSFGCYDWQTGEVKPREGKHCFEKAYRLDRAKFEATGEAYVKHDCFYALPYEKTERYQSDIESYHRQRSRDESSTPSFIRALGLALPCTIDNVKQAWRKLAKEHHPDTGGDAALFIELQASYSNALAFFGK